MIEWMEEQMCLDPNNVFATGFSNGGMITNRVACQASQLFKGVGPVAGNIRLGGSFDQCAPTTPVSWISVCGTVDNACTSDFDPTVQGTSFAPLLTGVPSPPSPPSAHPEPGNGFALSQMTRCLPEGPDGQPVDPEDPGYAGDPATSVYAGPDFPVPRLLPLSIESTPSG